VVIDGDAEATRVEVHDDVVPFTVRHRGTVYQLGRAVPLVHQQANPAIVQLNAEEVGVGGLSGIVKQQTAIGAGLQLEFPSARS